MVILKSYRSPSGPGTRIYEFKTYIAAAFVLFAIVLYQTFPNEYWLGVREIHVDDVYVGKPVIMEVDRTINRAFYADWNVVVRQIGGGKGSGRDKTIACTGAGGGDYVVDAGFPTPLTLVWWSNEATCFPLSAGRYRIETVWTIHTRFMGDRIVRVYSNEFEVKPK